MKRFKKGYFGDFHFTLDVLNRYVIVEKPFFSSSLFNTLPFAHCIIMSEKEEKKEGEEAPAVVIQVDSRINWFEEKVCNGLKVKSDKWKKMTALQENLYVF